MTTKTMAYEPDSGNEFKFGFWMEWKVCVVFTNFSRSILNTIMHCSTIITKTTDKSQTSTDKSQTSTDESQTTTDKSQTSHRRLQRKFFLNTFIKHYFQKGYSFQMHLWQGDFYLKRRA